MKKVIIESPYSGNIERNVAYAKAAIRDCLSRNESPIASHLLFTQSDLLDDTDSTQRMLGIEAGHAWIDVADIIVVYCDFGISTGMWQGIYKAKNFNKAIEFRSLNLGTGCGLDMKRECL